MTKARAQLHNQSGGASLPATVTARSGAVFDPRVGRWSFHDGSMPISVNFDGLAEFCSDELIEAAKFPCIWYAENMEAATLRAQFSYLRKLLRQAAAAMGARVTVIDAPLLANYRATLTKDKESLLGALSAFLKKWHSLGTLGVTDDAVRFLKSVRLKGAPKGVAVLTMDPIVGPLTDVERAATQAALNDAYATGLVTLEDYLLAWLSLLLGQRPKQYALLKVCDIKEVTKSDGAREYVLRVPRVKQGDSSARREEFKERLVTPSIGKVLVAYANTVRERYKASADPEQAPLFPQRGDTKGERPTLHGHATPGAIGLRITTVFEALEVYSERTGGQLKVNAKRLRHTIATSAAREGHGELIIAELLDHSDTQNVGVYVRATPEIVERIDCAVALRMAPLAHAFAGTVIRNESEAIRGDDPTSRIVDPRLDEKMKPMGNCSRNGSCGFLAPISCYTCKSFQAWVEGPHEAVLAYLIAERERLVVEADARIATVNDRTILAVAEVVRQVREMRGEAADGC